MITDNNEPMLGYRLVLGAIRIAIGEGRWIKPDFSLYSILTGLRVSQVKDACVNLKIEKYVVFRQDTAARTYLYALTKKGKQALPEIDTLKSMYKKYKKYETQKEETTMTKEKPAEKTMTKKEATKKTETKKAATKKTETKKAATKKTETKKAATKKTETKKAATKKTETKKAAENNGIKKPTRGIMLELWTELNKMQGRKKAMAFKAKDVVEKFGDRFSKGIVAVTVSKWKKFNNL